MFLSCLAPEPRWLPSRPPARSRSYSPGSAIQSRLAWLTACHVREPTLQACRGFPLTIGERLELIKDVVPKTNRVAALSNPDNLAQSANLRQLNIQARTLAIELETVTARSPNEFESAFSAAIKDRATALVLMPDALFHNYPSAIVGLAAKNSLPAIYDRSDFVEAGGLMSFAVNIADLSRRAAGYVDRIIKGSNPANLSIDEPTRYDLVINLKTAQALGLTIPPTVQARADRIIK